MSLILIYSKYAIPFLAGVFSYLVIYSRNHPIVGSIYIILIWVVIAWALVNPDIPLIQQVKP